MYFIPKVHNCHIIQFQLRRSATVSDVILYSIIIGTAYNKELFIQSNRKNLVKCKKQLTILTKSHEKNVMD